MSGMTWYNQAIINQLRRSCKRVELAKPMGEHGMNALQVGSLVNYLSSASVLKGRIKVIIKAVTTPWQRVWRMPIILLNQVHEHDRSDQEPVL